MQRSATKLKVDAAAEQLSLLIIPGKKTSRPVSFDRIYALETTIDAINYGCELAGVATKAIYGDMDIDKTVWSRICAGEWDLDGRDIQKFNKVVGNNAYLMFLNHQEGIDLHSIRRTMDDKDREIHQLRKELAEERHDKEVIARFVREQIR